MKPLFLLLLITLTVFSAFAADGDLDATFGTGGKVVTGNSFSEGGRDVAVQPDGKIITVGTKTSNFSSGNISANRYNANGSLDAGFANNGVYVLPLAAPEYSAASGVAVELQTNGKILLAGYGRTLTSSNAIFLLVRLNANGTLDTTFGSGGRVVYDLGNLNAYGGLTSMAYDAARNKIYLGGTIAIDYNNSIYGYGVVRFDGGNGAVDTSYNGTGKQVFMIGDSRGIFTRLYDIALQSDGRIVAVGGVQYIRASDNQSIESFGSARINVDGTLDASFGANGIVITDFPNPDSNIFRSAVARTVSILPNGKIFIGGTGGTGSGGSIRNFYFAAQLNADGSLDSSFGTGGKIRAEAIMIVDSAVTQTGKIIIIGEKNANFGVARLNPNGTIDTTFGAGGIVQTNFGTGGTENPFAIALQTDGKIVVSGGANNSNTSGPGQDYTLIARYNGTAAAPVSNPALRVADYDGDGKTDASVFRGGTWYINPSTAPNSFYGINFGLSTDKLAPADYDGDGKTDIAVWRENVSGNKAYFYILQSSDNAVRIAQFGQTGDVLTVGDWDGDGQADLSVYREGAQSYFYYRGSANNPNNGTSAIPWGTSGDQPARGDFDGDGKFDAAVYRPSNQIWYIRNSLNNQITYTQFGLPTDKRVSGDFDGDGKTDIAVVRDGLWIVLQSSNNQIHYQNWGLSEDTIAAGDYDGDGKTDYAVWRDGIYYILSSGNSAVSYQNFGASGDVPTASAFIR